MDKLELGTSPNGKTFDAADAYSRGLVTRGEMEEAIERYRLRSVMTVGAVLEMKAEPKAETKKVYWLGQQKCDICSEDLSQLPAGTRLYDASTSQGWAVLCELDFMSQGCQLGTGLGQLYEKQEDGQFLKIGG